MDQGLGTEIEEVPVTTAEFERWVKQYLPRGYGNDRGVASLALINSGNLSHVDWDEVWSLRYDVLVIQQLLDRVRFLLANWGELDYLKVLTWSLHESVVRIQRLLLEGTVDLRNAWLAKMRDPEADISQFAHPERVGFDVATQKGNYEPGRPQDNRLAFRLLLTPYNKLIEEEVEATIQATFDSRLEEKGERLTKGELKRVRKKIRSSKRRAVHRAWSGVREYIEGPVWAFFLAIQFGLTKYAERTTSPRSE